MTNDLRNKSGTLIIAIYSHIEAYPPSLNALHHLAGMFGKIIILIPNNMKSRWHYPSNVEVIQFGKFVDVSKAPSRSFLQKISYYILFGLELKKLINQHNPGLMLVYDPSSFALLRLFSGSLIDRNKIPVWYHNHDVADEKELPKYSLMRLSRVLELKYFHTLDFFTLPNELRLRFFPVQLLKTSPVILPNYPSKFLFGKQYRQKTIGSTIKLIFQGQISRSSLPAAFVDLLRAEINGRKIELHLAGPVDSAYLDELERAADRQNVRNQLIYHGLLPYSELPKLTASCDIGVAIYGDHNTMVRTMSTASNKIFEYASLGLPVIMKRRNDMKEEFGGYPWVHYCQIEESSLISCIKVISDNYSDFHTRARLDFEEYLNFEVAFLPFVEKLMKCVKNKNYGVGT